MRPIASGNHSLLLPDRIQKQAIKTYGQWKEDPFYPGLHQTLSATRVYAAEKLMDGAVSDNVYFKCIHKEKSVYSVRIGIGYRALGRRHGEHMIWFWIGSHEAYNDLVKRL